MIIIRRYVGGLGDEVLNSHVVRVLGLIAFVLVLAFILNSRLSVRDQTAASPVATPTISQSTPATPTNVPSPSAILASPTSVPATPVPSPTLAPTATPTGQWISLSPASGPPGTIVEIHGYVPNAPTPQVVNGQAEPSHGNGCWDGCPNGLREDALPLIWSTTQPGHFTMPLVVPSAPWLTADGPHALKPGDYTIGVTCLVPPTTAKKGPGFVPCDQRPAAATATFHLTGPASPRCQTTPCAQLTLSPDHGPPGTEVQVSGWAPLNDIIGSEPFVYNLVIENSGSNASAPFQLASVQQDLDGSIHGTARLPLSLGSGSTLVAGKQTFALETLITARANTATPTPSADISMTPLGKGTVTSFRVVLAPTTFTVSAAPNWAGLGSIHPIAIQPSASSDPSATIAGDPANSQRLAYCGPNSIQVSDDGGLNWSSIPTSGITQAMNGSLYEIFQPSNNSPRCTIVALDPGHPDSFYAAFSSIRTKYHSAPPTYAIAFFTDDAGKTWHLVPPPNGLDLSTFGGFQVTKSAVLALFAQPSHEPKPSSFLVQATSDGGKTWNRGQLPCPASGPCITWGAANMVVTGMGAMLPQPIERSTDNGKTWTPLSWPSTIATRYGSSQLVAFGSNIVALVGTGLANPQYPFLLSIDSGTTWRVINIPTLPNAGSDPLNFPGLTMLSNGDLIAWEQGSHFNAGHWDLLQSGATAWCSATGATLPVGTAGAAPFQVIGDHLWWLEGTQPSGNSQPTLKSAAVSALHCGGS